MRRQAAAFDRRQASQAAAAILARLRAMLIARGIDPAEIAALRRLGEAAAEPAAALPGDGAEDKSAPAGSSGSAAEELARRLAALALPHYRDGGRRPDPAQASVMEWYAWCLVAPPPTPEINRAVNTPRRGR